MRRRREGTSAKGQVSRGERSRAGVLRRSSLNTQSSTARRGSALIIVLIVIVFLTLGAYTFLDSMILERRAADFSARTAQSRALADSGIEYAAAKLGKPADLATENIYHNPTMFSGIVLLESTSTTERGRFSLVAPLENDTSGTQLRYGLVDESSKININAISALGLTSDQEHALMMSVPGMTDEIADSILDWVDADEEARTNGAESDSYQTGESGHPAKNGACESLDELLLVKGVTPELLYGEDANRNGLLDANENDGELTSPLDNQDGKLNLGWNAYLTVYSRESNLQYDGTERINANQPVLAELYDELEEEFGAEIATFVTAYRLMGPVTPSALKTASNTTSTGDADADDVIGQVAAGITQQVTRAATGTGGTGSTGAGDAAAAPDLKGGMDLSAGAKMNIASLYELVDAQVTVTIDKTSKTLDSPWASGSLSTTLPTLLEKMTTSTATTIDGRININQARKEILQGIPNMPTGLPDLIAKEQVIQDGQPNADAITERATTGWLLSKGLVKLEEIQLLDKYICARGDVFSMQSVGGFDRGGATIRIEAVIDATKKPPQVVFRRDLTHLGPGYRVDQLFVPDATATPTAISAPTATATK